MRRGSYYNGFAPRDAQPRFPQLWRGCIGAWAPCLGPSGVTLREWSGLRRNGTLTAMDPGTGWVTQSGRHALDFNGADDYVNLPYRTVSLPFSVTAWALSTSSTANQCVFSIGNSAINDQLFYLGFRGDLTGDPIVAQMRGNVAASTTFAQSATGYTVNRLHHLAAVFRSTTYRQVYLDGVPGTADTTSHTLESFNRSAIGCLYRTAAAVFLSGQVMCVEVYDRELSESEIRLSASRPGIAYEIESPRRYSGQATAAARARLLTLLGVGR